MCVFKDRSGMKVGRAGGGGGPSPVRWPVNHPFNLSFIQFFIHSPNPFSGTVWKRHGTVKALGMEAAGLRDLREN